MLRRVDREREARLDALGLPNPSDLSCRLLNRHHASGSGAISIGRDSKWGNPLRIGADGDRDAVIARHERWLRDQHGLLRELPELKGHDLLCYCTPMPCHGDILLRLANADREAVVRWWRSMS